MGTITLKVKDFSPFPGTRKIDEGKNAHSGEQFREEWLIPKYQEAKKVKTKLLVDLDGTIGFGTSWLEEVFGGLARIYSPEEVLSIIEFKTEEEPYLEEDIKHYIKHANG